jgi:hypothetical protein
MRRGYQSSKGERAKFFIHLAGTSESRRHSHAGRSSITTASHFRPRPTWFPTYLDRETRPRRALIQLSVMTSCNYEAIDSYHLRLCDTKGRSGSLARLLARRGSEPSPERPVALYCASTWGHEVQGRRVGRVTMPDAQ